MRAKMLLATAILLSTALAGCAGPADTQETPDPEPKTTLTSVFERVKLPFHVTDAYSHTLVEGVFDILDPISVFVDVDLPLSEGGAAVDPADPPVAHLGLFLPDIPGCDFSSIPTSIGERGGLRVPGSVDATPIPAIPGNATDCRVPVIADAGPYWGESDVAADARDSGRLGEFLIENFVPHGYAVAQISVMGSGKSNHCFDMFGLAEQLGVHHAVEWLGDQDWSNGNVGLIGRSYDGSTPWMAAAHATPDSALKTIVPISGLSGLQDLVTWNGASEARILLFHNAPILYGTFGVGGDDLAKDVQHRATCPDWMTATPWGAAGYATGDEVVPVDGTYWQERNFVDRVLQNYKGSLYMVHGLQDNNVDPHAGWIAQLALQENGNDVKSLWGQWYHSYPDRPGEHGGTNDEPRTSVRYDWAQDLLEWFDHYLKGTGPKPPLHHEIQQLDGTWRVEPGFPPADASVLALEVPMGELQVGPLGSTDITVGVVSEENDTLMGGLSSVTLQVRPTGPGGQVYVELRDSDGDFGLSYGIMDLRHASGSFAPVVPGQAMTITIPIQLFDAVLPAGEPLVLRIGHSGNDFLPSAQPYPVDVLGATVNLSTLERGPEHRFQPPLWTDDGMLIGSQG